MQASKLFQPIKIGDVQLQHRIVLAPMTRLRSSSSGVPLAPSVAQFYQQRASTPATLLITESVVIAEKAGGLLYIPGIYSNEQIAAWKRVSDAVHAKGSFIFMQILALGATASPDVLKAHDPPLPYVAPSPVKPKNGTEIPRALTKAEIKEYVQLFSDAASDAIEKAGFDEVEIHACHCCLLDQFLQDVTNVRTDEYGGSPENRSRFLLEVVEAVCKRVGEARVSVRFSPWSKAGGMRMANPFPTYTYAVQQLKECHPNLAFLHVVEPRVSADDFDEPLSEDESNDFIREIWSPKPLVSAGGFTPESASKLADETGGLVAFGRYFTSNPDLPLRIKHEIPFTPYERPTFYLLGDSSGRGYSDWPFAEISTR